MNHSLLGCIADDFTGATDLANNLVRAGWKVIQTIGIPDEDLTEQADAVVVALKTRTIPAPQAVSQSLQALRWLRKQGASQIYFKYCSTFDSTPQGNIGPVTEALMQALGADFTIACPAFPENGRTVFKGYLYVGDVLLHESGMRDHPLTPMTDSNLVRVLQAQTVRRVGLIDYRTVAQGYAAIAKRISALQSEGVSIAVIDALSDQDLLAMGPALAHLPLITAGSGVAIGLKKTHATENGYAPKQGEGKHTNEYEASLLPAPHGYRAIVSGSCSVATNGQVAHFLANGGKGFAIDPLQVKSAEAQVTRALAWAKEQLAHGPVLVYATAQASAVQAAQAQWGAREAGEMVEHILSSVAKGLIEMGVGQMIVAGGETSGACVQSLHIQSLRIGPQIAPGVPWCYTHSEFAPNAGIHLALKSGNFGGRDFFCTAFDLLA